MNLYTQWIDYWNRQVKKFSIYEVKLAQGAAMAITLIIAKLFPVILDLSIWWFVAIFAVCWARVWYVILTHEDEGTGAHGSGVPI